MARKICGLGFDCGAMMQCPGIDPGECPNYRTCGGALGLDEDEPFELVRARQGSRSSRLDQQERRRARRMEGERFYLTRRQAAAMMLRQRGCPQTADAMGLLDLARRLAAQIEQIEDALRQAENQYIVPQGCEVHAYNVKRPSRPRLRSQGVPQDEVSARQRVFTYNKLSASEDIFEPAERWRIDPETQQMEECPKVCSLHLSHEADPRHIEAVAGIERRNSLIHLRTALTNVVQLLESALQGFDETMPPPALAAPPIEGRREIWMHVANGRISHFADLTERIDR